jgi:hypothetical protein
MCRLCINKKIKRKSIVMKNKTIQSQLVKNIISVNRLVYMTIYSNPHIHRTNSNN